MAKQFGHCFTVLLFDIDHFKKVNDTYGHDAGDDVLRQISRLIKSNIRQSDIFARHGGEEFTLLLRKTEIDIGIKTAEKLRKSIENLKIETCTGVIPVTISIGVVQFSEKAADFDSLISLADEALYEAKDKGRNCVVYKKEISDT